MVLFNAAYRGVITPPTRSLAWAGLKQTGRRSIAQNVCERCRAMSSVMRDSGMEHIPAFLLIFEFVKGSAITSLIISVP